MKAVIDKCCPFYVENRIKHINRVACIASIVNFALLLLAVLVIHYFK